MFVSEKRLGLEERLGEIYAEGKRWRKERGRLTNKFQLGM